MKKLKLAALTGATMLSVTAFATDWFDGKIETGWPTVDGMNGAWCATATDLATFQAATGTTNDRLELDAGDSVLDFTATTAKDFSTDTASVTYTTQVQFYPFSAIPDTLDQNAKAGAIVVYNATIEGYSLYVVAQDPENLTTNKWTLFDSELTSVSTETAQKLTVTIAPKATANTLSVTYKIETSTDTVEKTFDVYSTSTSTSKACYSGSGYIESLTATAVASTITFNPLAPENASVTKVMNGEEGLEAPYTVNPGTTVTVTYTAASGYLFANGTDTMSADITVTVAGDQPAPAGTETVEGAASIGTTYYLTMQAAVDAADGNTVKLAKAITESVLYTGTKTFTIDLNGKVWSYTDGESGANLAALKVWNSANTAANITIKDGATGGKIYSTGKGFCIWAKTGNITLESGKFYNNDNDYYTIYANNTGSIEITGGEFVNENTDPYVYNPALSRLNLNVAQTQPTPNGTIVVKGGTFTAYPKDDSHTGDQSFLAAGYAATEASGIWTVALATYTVTITDAGTAEADPETYQISAEAQTITLTAAPTKDGYTFTGYTLTSETGATLDTNVITVPANTYGNIAVTANWEEEAKGTTFTVAATGCSVTVTIAGEPATEPYVAKVGETITFTLTPSSTMEVPAYSGTFGNESLNNTSFTGGAYSYEVTAESATAIDCQFTMIDAKNSSDVQPINVVPADTDPENVADAAANIATLATKSGESKADVTLTQNISAWVSSKSISGDSIAAVGTSAEGALTTEQFEEAYLLDCDELSTTAIENAKKEFVFEEITPGTVPTVKSNTFNGTITYEGSTDLQNWSTATTGHTFYRAVLSK